MSVPEFAILFTLLAIEPQKAASIAIHAFAYLVRHMCEGCDKEHVTETMVSPTSKGTLPPFKGGARSRRPDKTPKYSSLPSNFDFHFEVHLT